MHTDEINQRGAWPLSFNKLLKKFTQINTHLTFLSSHSRSTIPTYNLLNNLNSDISKLDLAIISYLLPSGDVCYKYVDENQVMVSFAEKVQFDWQTGYKQKEAPTMDEVYEEASGLKRKHTDVEGNQLLIFEFTDVKTHGIGGIIAKNKGWKKHKPPAVSENPAFFLSNKDLSMSSLTQVQLLNIIKSRNEKFKACIQVYLDDFTMEQLSTNISMEQLEDISANLIPQPPNMQDPVQEMAGKKKKVFSSDALTKPTPDEMIAVLKEKDFYKDQIVAVETLTRPQEAKFCSLPLDSVNGEQIVHPELEQALLDYKNISITEGLFSHQSSALKELMFSSPAKNVIVSTSTSSGKSLIYQLPIINDILWDISNGISEKKRSTTAFFVFPTKALAQDQKRHLQDFLNLLPSNCKRKIIVDTYDGDTNSKSRNFIRNFADIIFTNPDTIHASILPNHDMTGYDDISGWNDFLLSLKYIVMDELHVYKGTFGVHVSFVMSRLHRIKHLINSRDTAGFGNQLKFISCSATILNPISHFRTVCALPITEEVYHVYEDGSPMSEKKLIIWQPTALMNKRGESQTTLSSATSLASPIRNPFIARENIIPALAKVLVQLLVKLPSVKVIVFCPIRQVCELMMKEVRNLLASAPSSNSSVSEHDIMSYRGGYSKSDRRQIETKMFTGQLRAIIATNALELGIDLSDLDVVITAGFPALKLNLHQQFGRAGRGSSSKGSLAIFVASASPVDQYYVNNPLELCDKLTYEDLCVEGLMSSSLNQLIMEMHLQCAAFEQPIVLENDAKWFTFHQSKKEKDMFIKLCQDRLRKDTNGKYCTNIKYLPRPSENVSIRAIEETNYAVVDITNGRNIVIEEIEALRTSFTLYEGAIFLHQGFPYLVKEFNTDDHFAKVIRVKVDWVTLQRDFTDVDPQEVEVIKCLQPPKSEKADIPIFFGKIETTIIVFGYFKVNRRSEILEAVEVNNPPVKYLSKGFWVDIPKNAISIIEEKNLSPPAGIHAAQHAILNILPLFINGGATTNANARFSSNIGEAELSTECKAPEKEFARRESKRKRPARLIFHDSKGGPHGSGVAMKTFEHIDEILYTTYLRVQSCVCEWGCPLCVAANFCKEQLLVMSKPAAILILGALCGLDLSVIKDQVADGPEANMPKISVETIQAGGSHVKFSRDVEILEVRKANKPLKPVVKIEEVE